MSHDKLPVIKSIYVGFADDVGVHQVFEMLYPNYSYKHPDVVGMGMPVDELVFGYVHGFYKEVQDVSSPHYMFKSLDNHVNAYLKRFDVKPEGADVLKYICAFGYELEQSIRAKGERELVCTMIRLNTIRLLRAAAGLKTGCKPPERMVQKIFKIWRDNDAMELLGKYGTYMMFKTWTKLPAQVRLEAKLPAIADLQPALDAEMVEESQSARVASATSLGLADSGGNVTH